MYKTLKQANNWVAKLATLGKTHVVFHLPAFHAPYKFGTCELAEKPAYEADGAVFV